MKTFLGLVLAAGGLLSAALADGANRMVFRSAETQASLLELYTSEGCSSCPPAEAWLSQLKSSPGLWRDFVPVAFHVDYWDHLGWRDAWAKPEFTARQHAYAQGWRTRGVYTPGFVLNGSAWRPGSRDFERERSTAAPAGVFEIRSTNLLRWEAAFAADAKLGARVELHVALSASGLASTVQAGENHGRRLTHDFTVLALRRGPLELKDGVWRGVVNLPAGAHRSPGRLAVAARVSVEPGFKPLQAVGGWLAPQADR